jgi:hypothetical protein
MIPECEVVDVDADAPEPDIVYVGAKNMRNKSASRLPKKKRAPTVLADDDEPPPPTLRSPFVVVPRPQDMKYVFTAPIHCLCRVL